MKLKRIFAMALALLVVCATVTTLTPPLTVEAHSGRTDSNGGHHDYKNVSGLGSYHYHHGYPAHLHPDGICPYTEAVPSSNTSGSDNSNQSVTISDTSYDNAAFNASYYANYNSDVYKACGNDAKALYDHFITSGIYEGRQSSAQFSILVYKENNQDLVAAFGDDLIKYYNHFIESGVNEDRISK